MDEQQDQNDFDYGDEEEGDEFVSEENSALDE